NYLSSARTPHDSVNEPDTNEFARFTLLGNLVASLMATFKSPLPSWSTSRTMTERGECKR
ncbi:MAG: hypothetical protein QXF69_06710, partial [Thermofilaceae archaeon]